MGQCCSSRRQPKQKTSKKNLKNTPTTTVHNSFYSRNITSFKPSRHPFSLPDLATPQQPTQFGTLAAHLCDCSYSTRCPHRPAARQTGHRRFSTQDAHPSLPTTLRQRRVTAPSYPSWRPHNLHEIHSLRPLTEIGAPIHSSTVIAEHQESCQVHSLGLSTSDSPSRLFQNAPDCSRVFQNTVLEEETVSSQDGSETSERRERGVYGYQFKPKKQLSTFEKSVICV